MCHALDVVEYLVHLLHPASSCCMCEYTSTCVYSILCHQGGQTGHRLSGEVPHCMQHISGMNPVVI